MSTAATEVPETRGDDAKIKLISTPAARQNSEISTTSTNSRSLTKLCLRFKAFFYQSAIMATKSAYQTTFEAERVIQPIYTGGAVSLETTGRILATTLGEEALLTDLNTGRELARIEGDGEVISTLTRMWLREQTSLVSMADRYLQ